MSNNTTTTTTNIYKYDNNDNDEEFDILWSYLYMVVIILCYDMMIKQYIKNYINHRLHQYEENRFTDIATIRREPVNPNEADV